MLKGTHVPYHLKPELFAREKTVKSFCFTLNVLIDPFHKVVNNMIKGNT